MGIWQEVAAGMNLTTKRIKGIIAVLQVAEAGTVEDVFGYDNKEYSDLYHAAMEGLSALHHILEKREHEKNRSSAG